MGLFDIFDSSGGKQAAQQGYNSQTGGLTSGNNQYNKYAKKSIGALKGGQNQAIGALNEGQGYYQQALQPNQQMFDTGSQGVDRYGTLVGLNGQQAASDAFQNSPGYNFQQEQGLEALNRTANARGMLQSGNNTQDILKYSQGLASQDYYNQLQALQPYFGQQQNGASGLTNTYGNLAGNAANKANVYTGTASNIANVYGNQGTNAYNTQANIGQAGADLAQNKYAAEQGASQNMWNAILGVGNMATGGVANYVGAGGKF